MAKPKRRRYDLKKLLLTRYQADPEGFCTYLPEVADALGLGQHPAGVSRSPFGLTEQERRERVVALQSLVQKVARGDGSRDVARQTLEHCAVLVEDGNLPDEIGPDQLTEWVRRIIGKAPSTVAKETTFSVAEGPAIAHRISLVRGITINADWAMQLLSITISPAKMRQRRKLLRLVGLAHDSAKDVAERHDAYLNVDSPHAAA